MWHGPCPSPPGGTQKMGDDLPIIVVEQGGLWPDKDPDKAGVRGETHVVLGASGMSQQERPVPRWHLEIGGQGRQGETVGIQPLW
jgi:hypothetical protein